MFTGLVLGTGRIINVSGSGNEARIAVSPDFEFDNPQNGESVAVNGACLTLESHSSGLLMYASAETLGRTNVGQLRPGSVVNLERALAVGDRLGGHIVSGHVDCLAEISGIREAGQSRIYTLRFPSFFSKQIIAKGSIALDGISLTINSCGTDFLEVNIIPETRKTTSVETWKTGSKINMETDMIGKYVQNLLAPWADKADTYQEKPDISFDFLRKHGF
ncbi:MAG: riboflavin synthase [Thermodesulfobacteriota bacterium]